MLYFSPRLERHGQSIIIGAWYGFLTIEKLYSRGGREELLNRGKAPLPLAAVPEQADSEAGGGAGHAAVRAQPPAGADAGRQAVFADGKGDIAAQAAVRGKLVEEHKRRAFRAAGDRAHRRARDTAARAARLSAPEPRHLREAERGVAGGAA